MHDGDGDGDINDIHRHKKSKVTSKRPISSMSQSIPNAKLEKNKFHKKEIYNTNLQK